MLRKIDLHSANNNGITLQLADETATLAYAQRLANALQSGMVIYLQGELGAGKTTLVRGILNALGYHGRVKSPTYTLLEPYSVGDFELRHFDLYRLHSPAEWQEAGFDDEFDGKCIFLIEWPQQALGFLPAADLLVELEVLPVGRVLNIQANSTSGEQCLQQL
jgi:tRNA threonylcarbamoyladenosine biosynthesis protein TsaE